MADSAGPGDVNRRPDGQTETREAPLSFSDWACWWRSASAGLGKEERIRTKGEGLKLAELWANETFARLTGREDTQPPADSAALGSEDGTSSSDAWEGLRQELLHIGQAIVRHDGKALRQTLQLGSPELRSDRQTLLDVVRQDGGALQFAREDFLEDREVVLEAARQNSAAFMFGSEALRGDKDFVLESLREDLKVWNYVSRELFVDKDVVLEVLRKEGGLLKDVSEELRDDKDAVHEAVRQSGLALKYASPRLKNDKDIVLEAVKTYGHTLEFASQDVQADKDVVLAAVRKAGTALCHASEELRADAEVVLAAVGTNGAAFQYASEELQNDKDIMLLAVRCFKSGVGLGIVNHAMRQRYDFSGIAESSIAGQGETVPTLSVSMSLVEADEEKIFRCHASLLSGASFVCDVPDRSYADLSGRERPGPNLNDLARRLVFGLPTQPEAKKIKRVFINFVLDESGEAMAVSPWEWDRPLADYLPKAGDVWGAKTCTLSDYLCKAGDV